MDNPVLITRPEQLHAFNGADLFWPYTAEDFERHRPDAHWLRLDAEGNCAARCSIWWRQTPSPVSNPVGFIGHYAAANLDSAQRILGHAAQELARHGCTLAVGPIDGSTWRRYRFVTERGNRPPFFLEPSHPPEWPQHWATAGFDTFVQYVSSLNGRLDYEDPRGREAGERLRKAGVRLRTFDASRFEDELERVYPLIVSGFRQHLFYSPVTLESFLAQYRKLQSVLQPELITIAEQNGQPVGLVFAVPDLLQRLRGETVDTAIIKTLVISSRRACAGLGCYLAAHSQLTCRALGYQRVIHALMQEGSISQNISARYGAVMRRYAVFAKRL